MAEESLKEILDIRVQNKFSKEKAPQEYWEKVLLLLQENEPELSKEKSPDDIIKQFKISYTGLEVGETGDPKIDYYAGKLLRNYIKAYEDIKYSRSFTIVKPQLKAMRENIKNSAKKIDKDNWEKIYDEFNHLLDQKLQYTIACK